MEIIEKVKEIPAPEYFDRYGSGRKDINGKANAGLTLGIIGTALGAWALWGRGRSGGFGAGAPGLDGANININGVGGGSGSGRNCPSAYEVQMKECEDVLALQGGIYTLAQNTDAKIFNVWKSQVDADFGLYKSTRDGFDILSAKHNQDAFNLYKSQRDGDDSILRELSDLKAQVAINSAVRPYQDKLIQCEIDKAFTAGINYTDRKTCNVIYGQVVLPNEPTVTGYAGANRCGCPTVIAAPTA